MESEEPPQKQSRNGNMRPEHIDAEFDEPDPIEVDKDPFLDGFANEIMFACDSPLNDAVRLHYTDDVKARMIDDTSNDSNLRWEIMAYVCPILSPKHYALAKDDPSNGIITLHQIYSFYHGVNNHCHHEPTNRLIGNIPSIAMRCIAYHGPTTLPSGEKLDLVSISITCKDCEMFDFVGSRIRKDAIVVNPNKLQYTIKLPVYNAMKFKTFMDIKYSETMYLWSLVDQTKFPNVKYMRELARLKTEEKYRTFIEQYKTPVGYYDEEEESSDEDD